MNIINYLPGIILAMLLSFNIALFVRIYVEGTKLGGALLSLFRFYFMPLAVLFIVKTAYNNRRNILFKYKKDSTKTDEDIKNMETLLNSRVKMLVIFIKLGIHLYRNIIDTFVKSSIEYEKQKSIKLKSKNKNKSNKRFFDYFLNDVDYEQQLIHRI